MGWKQWLSLTAGLFTISLFLRIICYTGLIASDDLVYARHAERVANHAYRLESYHMATRYGVFVPVGMLYRLFGVHEWTTVALPLIHSSLAAVLTAIIAAHLEGPAIAWLSGFLMATFPVELRYGTILVPEPFLQTMLLFAALLFVLAEKKNEAWLGF